MVFNLQLFAGFSRYNAKPQLVVDLRYPGHGWITSDAIFANLQEMWQEIDADRRFSFPANQAQRTFGGLFLITISLKSAHGRVWFVWGKKWSPTAFNRFSNMISSPQMTLSPTVYRFS